MTETASPLRSPDRIPAEVLCTHDYEALAASFMEPQRLAYIQGGSGHDLTAHANVQSFQHWAIRPRLLRDVSAGHTRLPLAGTELSHPILLAPVAFQKLAHPDAEVATARAAQATDTPMVLSTLSTCTLEAVAQVAGSQRWFQLYLQPQREDTLALLRRAEAAGYQAIVLTLDATIQAPSLQAQRAGFQMPAQCTPANLAAQNAPGPITLEADDSRIFQGLMTQAPTWQDLDWLMAHTRLPLWIKGVLHPQDARLLQARGVAGLVVSNHGGRTLDGVIASLQALPAIRSAVGPDFPLLFDGGIRSGSDVFKALALGANAVLVGRLQMYALSVAGALGVAHMLKLLREELEVCMAQAGCATVSDINIDALVPHPGSHPC